MRARFKRLMTDFDQFVASHVDDLLRTAYLIVWDEGEAEDLVQECLLKLARRWDRIATMEQPYAYARRVLVNLAVRESPKRSRRRAELSEALIERGAEPDTGEVVGIRDELWAALRQLTPRERAVLVLRYFHDLSETQVAEMLGLPIGTVSSTASRSLAQLRELIGAEPAQARSDHHD